MSDPIELLAKPDVQKLLATLEDQAMSARELSEETGVPLTSTYRYMNNLVDSDLVEKETKLDPGGHHYDIYNIKFKGVFLYVEDGEVRKDICKDSSETDKLIWAWKKLRGEN